MKKRRPPRCMMRTLCWPQLLAALGVEHHRERVWRDHLPAVLNAAVQLKVRIASLEMDNYKAHQRAELVEYELSAARTRERHLLRLLAGKTAGAVPAGSREKTC